MNAWQTHNNCMVSLSSDNTFDALGHYNQSVKIQTVFSFHTHRVELPQYQTTHSKIRKKCTCKSQFLIENFDWFQQWNQNSLQETHSTVVGVPKH